MIWYHVVKCFSGVAALGRDSPNTLCEGWFKPRGLESWATTGHTWSSASPAFLIRLWSGEFVTCLLPCTHSFSVFFFLSVWQRLLSCQSKHWLKRQDEMISRKWMNRKVLGCSQLFRYFSNRFTVCAAVFSTSVVLVDTHNSVWTAKIQTAYLAVIDIFNPCDCVPFKLNEWVSQRLKGLCPASPD